MAMFHRLGRALRFLREHQGKSQKTVAAAAGITAPMLSAYENERAAPELETLDKILSDGLAVSLRDLTWALDVVNDRKVACHAGEESEDLRRPPVSAGRLTRELEALLRADTEDPLELGYQEILQGLLRISRTVFEAVADTRDRRTPSDTPKI